jgi:hypothetical protein
MSELDALVALTKAGRLTTPLQVQEAAARQANTAANTSGDANSPGNVSWGKPIPELMGNTRTVAYPLWSGNPRCVGKDIYGINGTHFDELDFAVMVGHPQILRRKIALVRIWMDGVCVHDTYSGTFIPGICRLPNGTQCGFRFYDSTQQDSDPTMRRALGAVPAFTNRIYLVFSNFVTRISTRTVTKSGQTGNYGYGNSQPDTLTVITQFAQIPEIQVELFEPELGSEVGDDQRYTLRDMFLNYSLLAGYTEDQVELDKMDVGLDARGNLVQGSQLNQTTDYKDLLAQLCSVYRIDMLETELGGLRFIRSYADRAIDLTIAAGEYVPVSDTDGTTVQLDRAATNEVPTQLEVSYLNSDAGCVPANVTIRRTKYPKKTTETDATMQLSVPVNMRLGQATSYAGEALFDMWSGKSTFSFKLPPSFLSIQPGDILSVQRPSGATDLCKVTTVEISPIDFTVTITASGVNSLQPSPYYMGTDRPALAEPLPGDVPLRYGTMTSPSPQGQRLTVIDTVNFGDAVHGPGNYPVLLVSNQALDVYVGGSFNAKPTLLASTLHFAQFGNVVTPLPFDNIIFQTRPDASFVVSKPPGADLVSVSDDDFYAGKNNVALGKPGLWEVVYFRDVKDNGDGTLTLSHLLRCRFDTEAADGQGVAGDLAVFSILDAIPASLNSPDDSDVFIYGATPGSAPSKLSGISDRVAIDKGAFATLAPINVHAKLQANNDIVFTWQRRERRAADDFWSDPELTYGPEQYVVSIKQAFPDAKGNVVWNDYPVVGTRTLTYPYLKSVIEGNNRAHEIEIKIKRSTNNPAGDITQQEVVNVQQS